MRQLTVILFLCLAFLGAAAPTAEANKYKPASGTKFKLRPGKKATIKVVGFQGCKMEALASSGDENVVQVTASSGSTKSPTVTLTAVSPGSTTVDVMLDSESPSCEIPGFFEVIVEPDPKAFVKQAKGKLKAAASEMKKELNAEVKFVCDDFKALEAAIKAGEIDANVVVLDLFPELEDFAFALEATVQETLEATYQDIWGRAEESGFVNMTPDLLKWVDGGCGDWDKFVGSSLKMADAAGKKTFKKYKKLIKLLDKSYPDDGPALITSDPLAATPALTVPITLPAETPVPPTPAVPKPLKKGWTAAGRMSSSPTSNLRVGGTVEPGGDVTVRIIGPGVDISAAVPVNEDCEFSAEFNELPPGTYHVEMTRGDEKVTFTKYVP